VIVPSFTFVATVHALQWQGITPVFADIDPATHNIDPAVVERLITARTTGIVGVHVWGRPCDTDALAAIARRRSLALMFDAAHALGCSHGGRMLGGFGTCEVLSFHATKVLNSFEGGAVVTNDDELAARLRRMRNFGFRGLDTVDCLGINGKMTEVCAAMGVTSLDAMGDVIAVNRRNYEAYRAMLSGVPGLSLMAYDPAECHSYQYVVVEVSPDISRLDRDELVAVLHGENIRARKYFWPACHRMEPYRSLQPNASLLLPETERLAARVLVLPTGQSISVEAVEIICDVIRTALERAGAVREALASPAPAIEA
jgi:dTDP-4-amino-4,6-dideoxygalactose transaminase